jgi:hypothetical protein
MVDGFTKEGKFRPTDRSPLPSSQGLTVRELLPKTDSQAVKERQSKRLDKFAQERKEKQEEKDRSKNRKFARKLGGGAKAVGRGLQFGAETIKQRRIEKSAEKREEFERLDREIDDIIDDPSSSDARKFRLIVRLASDPKNTRFLSKDQRRFLDRTNKELAFRIREERKASPTPISVGGGGVGSGISPEQFAKLPQDVRDEIRQQV